MKQLKARQEEQKTQQEKKPSKAPAALDVAALKKEEAEGEEDSPYFSPTAEGAQKADGVVFPSNVQQMLAPGETESEAVIQKKIKLEEQQEETLERALDLGVGKTNTDPSHKEADPNPEDTPLHQLDVHYWIHTRQNNRLLYLRDTIIGIVLHRLFTLEDTLEPSSVALRQYDYIISLCFNNHPKGTSAGLHSMSPFSSPASSRPPSANSSSMPSPLPRFPGFGKSELNTLLFEEEKSPTTEEWNTLYDAHLAKMGSLSSLEEYFDKENASQLKALQSSVILLYYTLQEDMQKQILAGVCGNLQWWPLVMEFFFVNLIVHTSPIVSPSSFHNQNSNSAFLLGPSTASEASDTTTNNNNKGNPRGQFYKSTSHVLLYLAPSLSLHGQTKEGVDLLHQLVKIVTSGFYEETFSAQNTHGVSYLDDPQARVPRASNAAAMAPSTLASKGRRTSMLPPTRHSKKC
ncbi:hypothetical protein AGDE_13224 [Angomonas deanei]|uniref:Uncharacterized protein n=1 Tax=Angomonas deanei TaxID=59799 RepID=A0A7G2CSR8_9TRYP|nr:hypothetical protein AGDE_13224 [Angomonas deanei]CAD2221463.1 hypothetical protein, conserved [Angomonas deanei]|eukprot:EPY22618.1 hypothetical protein AGDE_13224 [Angomonas deanei]